MFDHILEQMQENVRGLQYVMTVHAEEEMDADELSVYDIEHGILTGEIVERQKDRKTGDWKYLIEGKTLANDGIAIVAKLSPTNTVVIITIYLP